jgi:zinc protease
VNWRSSGISIPSHAWPRWKKSIDTPDKANAIYLSGLVFPLRDTDEDYPSLVIANFIYGGGSLSSRLGNRVRQKEGLSYGVGAGFSASAFEPRAVITTNAICNPQNIGKVQKVIQEELERILREGITQQELDDAKLGYLQSRNVRRASDSALASTLAGHSYTGRTMAFDAEMEKKISALTTDQILNSLRKYIDPGKLIIVTAGDFNAESAREQK